MRIDCSKNNKVEIEKKLRGTNTGLDGKQGSIELYNFMNQTGYQRIRNKVLKSLSTTITKSEMVKNKENKKAG
jgi:uncharacterized protein (DUF2141 family)